MSAPGSLRWEPPPRPRWLERLNALGGATGGSERLVGLDPEELRRAASQSTGLDDFGGGDWASHYECLLEALERESHLTVAGRILARAEILRSLRNRLKLEALWGQAPRLRSASPAPAVFIVGSPRTGTSILQELLACDPATRSPAMWEMLHPVESLDGEEMRPVADDEVQLWHDLQPEYEAMHANSGELPNECIFITANEFLSDHWGGCHVVPSYDRHLYGQDHRPAYRFHRSFLATLEQRRRAERWVLKAPSHLSQLRALFDVYPEARVIHTHRDPLKCIPSALSLMGTLKWMRCERVDMAPLAHLIPAGFAYNFQREIEQRADGTLPDDRFVDLHYGELVRDPIPTLAALYERLGWEFSGDFERAARAFIERKPKGSRGTHRYSLEEFGLDADEERERFRFYCERFGVPEEE